MASDAKITRAAEIMDLLSSPVRLGLMVEADGTRSVGELTEILGVSMSAVSQHLIKLKAASFVTMERNAQANHYKANPEVVVELIGLLQGLQ
jgi:DNA-binding transcriptional ArsR family regulator